jgi:hypothetical protein
MDTEHVENSLGEDQSEITPNKQRQLQPKNVFILLIIAVTVLVLLLTIFFLGIMQADRHSQIEQKKLQDQINYQLELNKKLKNDQIKLNAQISTTPLPTNKPTPSLEDVTKLLNETPKPRTQFDLSTWKTFEDKEVGIRFKYPQEWGEATRTLINNKQPTDSNGWSYDIRFSNNDRFDVLGSSKDFVLEVGGIIFKGFGFGEYEFKSPEHFCIHNDVYLIYCQPENTSLQVLTGANIRRWGPSPVISSFNRLYFYDRPTKLISGLQFRSEFLSSEYDPLPKLDSDKKRNEQLLNNLVLERKLDTESIRNYDTIEKVFETIEEI